MISWKLFNVWTQWKRCGVFFLSGLVKQKCWKFLEKCGRYHWLLTYQWYLLLLSSSIQNFLQGTDKIDNIFISRTWIILILNQSCYLNSHKGVTGIERIGLQIIRIKQQCSGVSVQRPFLMKRNRTLQGKDLFFTSSFSCCVNMWCTALQQPLSDGEEKIKTLQRN